MSITAYFEQLGVPLTNSRWSWGSVRSSDGAVFLRVWQDQTEKGEDGILRRVQITDHAFYDGVNDNLGYNERLIHVAAIKDGSPCYMVMCCAKDSTADPRQIQSVNTQELFVGGDLVEIDGDTWISSVGRVPWQEVAS